MKKCLLLLGILVAASAAVMAGTIDVPFDQPTIQAGIDAAGSGDTVLVDSGLYVENITFAGKSIVVTSSHGANSTVVEAADPAQAVVSFNSEEPKGAEISGCTITGSTHTGVLCANSSPTIRDNIITGNSSDERNIGAGIYLMNTTGAMIQGNVIYDNSAEEYGCAMHFDGLSYHDTVSYNLIYGSAGGDIEIRLLGDADSTLFHNNTISVTHAHGICHQADGTIIVKNNIIFFAPGFAVYAGGGTIIAEYNCTFANNADYNFIPGIGNIYDYAEFVDTTSHDYRLSANSPCIDVGDPDPAYDDADGTRNDMGAFPHLLGTLPYARLNFGSEDFMHVLDQTPDIYWEYFDTLAAQAAYQIQVGTDNDWSVAEMWDTGPVSSSATSTTYAGAPLLDGSTYYIRLGVNNGISWGGWDVHEFRMNSVPTIPTPVSPINQAEVPSSLVRLKIDNSSDAEGDPLTYDFEVYEDAALTMLFDSQTSIQEQPGQTMSDPFGGFMLDTEYWWRARSWDSYEYSDWSDTGSFITRDSCTVQLPGDADNDGDIDQDDVDYLSAYLCQAGPAPIVPANGDANGSCYTDSGDVLYLEAYLAGGPAPVTCTCIEPSFGGCSPPCDCRPGEANNDLAFAIGDPVYVINYIFKNGPPPMPYEICSGDFNGDCVCNIGDVVAGINYIFKNGPPMVSCEEWRTNCGYTLYRSK